MDEAEKTDPKSSQQLPDDVSTEAEQISNQLACAVDNGATDDRPASFARHPQLYDSLILTNPTPCCCSLKRVPNLAPSSSLKEIQICINRGPNMQVGWSSRYVNVSTNRLTQEPARKLPRAASLKQLTPVNWNGLRTIVFMRSQLSP